MLGCTGLVIGPIGPDGKGSPRVASPEGAGGRRSSRKTEASQEGVARATLIFRYLAGGKRHPGGKRDDAGRK